VTNPENKYQLIRDQLAAYIPYEQAEGIAQLKMLGHQKTLNAAIDSTSKEGKVQDVLNRIDEISNG
jgi:hypothetical protein